MPSKTRMLKLVKDLDWKAIRDDLAGCRALFDALKTQGIDIDEVTGTLLKDGVALFARSFDELLANLEQKRKQVRAAG